MMKILKECVFRINIILIPPEYSITYIYIERYNGRIKNSRFFCFDEWII